MLAAMANVVEPLPDNYVERPRETEAIIQALAGAGTGETRPLVGITAALRGAGGYGKTTLARIIANSLGKSVRIVRLPAAPFFAAATTNAVNELK